MLTLPRKELLSRLEPAARVAPTRTPKEILRWVRLTHDGKVLTVTAWDGEVGIRLTMACEGQACDFLLPAAHAVAVIKEFTSEFIKIDPQDSRTHVSGNREKFSFPTHPTTDFPAWEHSGEEFTLSTASFIPAVKRVRCAVSEGDARYALTGIYLNPKLGHVAATNSVLLCCDTIPGGGPDIDGVLPIKLANSACSVLVGDFTVRMSKGAIEFDDGHSVVFGRLVQGRFPRYADVLSGAGDVEVSIGVGDLLRVTRQAMLASDVERKAITIEIGGGNLKVSSGSTDRGDSCAEVSIPSDATAKVEVDGSFLASMLAGLDPFESAVWHVSKENFNRFVIRNWTGGIMPMAER